MVIFFDIDGTLLDTGGAGWAALQSAFAETFSVPVDQIPEVSLAGAVDSGLFLELHRELIEGLENATVSEVAVDQIYPRYVEILERNLRSNQFNPRLLTGAEALVKTCASLDGVTNALITGNILEGARAKLDRFGLWEQFQFGGFGCDAPIRDAVAIAAVKRAQERGERGDPSTWWVLGDTPKDIACARAAGLRVAAVSTGGASTDELADANPDVLLTDLSDCEQVLNILGVLPCG